MNNKVCFFVNSHLFTVKHRLPLAKFLKEKNYIVHFIVPDESKAHEEVQKNGFPFKTVQLSRSKFNFFSEMKSLIMLFNIIKFEKPDFIINATIKPVLYGTLLSSILKVPYIINLITGLGSVFTNNKLTNIKRYLIQTIYFLLFKFLKQNVIFQNKNDFKTIIKKNIKYSANFHIIPGSGVVDQYKATPINNKKNIIFVGRIIHEKGIKTFVETAKIIKKKRKDISFILVGPADFGNPSSISNETIRSWENEGIVSWQNEVQDMEKVYSDSTIIVLPSIREGFPKVLLEAGLCSRPVIASNVPGCRDVVLHGKTGFLFRYGDHKALSEYILKIIDNKTELNNIGKYARKHIYENFTDKIIIPKYFDIITNKS